MNPYTGEVSNTMQTGFVPVPDRFEEEARRHVSNGTKVDLKGNSELAKFAAKQRKKNRDRAKAAKRSRKAHNK